MKEYNNPFLYGALSIDVHGCTRDIAVSLTKSLIEDALRVDNKLIVIIHGKGTGILKTSIHEYLKHDKRVLEYKIDMFNEGQTIVNLK